MFAFIRGKLHSTTNTAAVVEAGGLGYEIHLPASLLATLQDEQEEVFFHLSMIVRETSHTLYGFENPQQKELFEVLLGVSGIGPKTALHLVGNMSIDAFQEAIRSNDLALICKVPGIGKKTAQRLMLDIKDKIPALASRDLNIAGATPDPANRLTRDAMGALINLGYTQSVSQGALKQALKDQPDPPNLPALITAALQHI